MLSQASLDCSFPLSALRGHRCACTHRPHRRGTLPSRDRAARGRLRVRHVDGADRAALLPALADADAVIVRSATRIDAEALAHAPRLRVVARAGVGLDNVDVEAATKAGVMVVNAPTSNIVSAAEHAVGLLLAVARNVPQAAASLQGRAVEAVRVHRRRAAGQGGRASSGWAGSACWSPSGWPRSACRWSPTTRTCPRPAPPSSASGWPAWTSCWPRPTSSPCTCRRTPRRSA